MRYMADVLTLGRIAASAWLLAWVFLAQSGLFQLNYATVLVVVSIAGLSSLASRAAMRRWPYVHNKHDRAPWRRQNYTPALFSGVGDMALFVATSFALALHDLSWMFVQAIALSVTAGVFIAVDAAQRRKSHWSARLESSIRWFYGTLMCVMIVFIAAIVFPGYWWVCLVVVFVGVCAFALLHRRQTAA